MTVKSRWSDVLHKRVQFFLCFNAQVLFLLIILASSFKKKVFHANKSGLWTKITHVISVAFVPFYSVYWSEYKRKSAIVSRFWTTKTKPSPLSGQNKLQKGACCDLARPCCGERRQVLRVYILACLGLQSKRCGQHLYKLWRKLPGPWYGACVCIPIGDAYACKT